MGGVYRARDTRLDREVAIKVLPASLSSDASLKQRLEREAKAISKLSHPHICTLQGHCHQDGVDFLVMEYLEGETLEQRLSKGPLPPEQTMRIAAQMAGALAKAQIRYSSPRSEAIECHVDENGRAKLMDFGLAKEFGPAHLPDVLMAITAEQSKLTAEGMIVGTFQVHGARAIGRQRSRRTHRHFHTRDSDLRNGHWPASIHREYRASLVAAILSSEPQPMKSLQPMTPAALERVVRKCLTKDSRTNVLAECQRSGNRADLDRRRRLAGGRSGARSSRQQELAARKLASTATFSLVVAGGAAWWKASDRRPTAMYFQISVPFSADDVALSRNGRMLAMVAYSKQTNNYVLWTNEVGGPADHSVGWDAGRVLPILSPDGRSIGLFADGKLKKVDSSEDSPRCCAMRPTGVAARGIGME